VDQIWVLAISETMKSNSALSIPWGMEVVNCSLFYIKERRQEWSGNIFPPGRRRERLASL
jgi:hypothetical protein